MRRIESASRAARVAAALGAALLVAVVTYGLARVSLEFFKVPGSGSAMWWPTAGAVLVIVVRCPRRWWPLLLLVFGVVNAVANESLGGWVVTLTYSVVNIIEIVVAGLLLVNRGEPGSRRLRTPADAIRFAVAFIVSVAVGSAVVAARTLIVPQTAPIHEVVGGYATTHILGLLAFAPLLLPAHAGQRKGIGQEVEFVIALGAAVALAWWAFLTPDQAGRAFPVLLPVIWASIRLGAWRATAVSLASCGVAIYGTSRALGTFVSIDDLEQRQWVTQLLVATITLTTIAVVLITRHRAQLAAQAYDSEETLRVAIRDAMVGMYSMRLDPGHLGEISDVNLAFAAMLGYRPDQLIGRSCKILNPQPDPASNAQFDAWLREFASGTPESFRRETRFFTVTGEPRWVEVSATRVAPSSAPPFALIHVHDLTEREQAKNLLERMALHDALTGLPNRSLLFERLDQLLRHAEREGRLVGLLYLDLDGFKPVNDEHGHDAGDAVLVEVAHRLTLSVRAEDTVARLGGDEFAILCPRVDTDADLDHIAARVHAAMRDAIVLPDGTPVTISISIGSAMAGPATVADELVRAADRAMYAAKRDAATIRPAADAVGDAAGAAGAAGADTAGAADAAGADRSVATPAAPAAQAVQAGQ